MLLLSKVDDLRAGACPGVAGCALAAHSSGACGWIRPLFQSLLPHLRKEWCWRWKPMVALVWLCCCVMASALAEDKGEPGKLAAAVPGPSATLWHEAIAASSAHPGESGFVILDTGHQAFLQRAALIEAAESSIDAQYYIWNSDVSGLYLARRLLLAADRGVKVRLLLDDINVAGRDATLAALDFHPNIEIRIYNPSPARHTAGKWLVFAAEFQRLNRRMHNKTFVVDGTMGVAGGRNIGDEYFDLHPQMNFRDRDLLAAGPLVADLTANFNAYWHSPWSVPMIRLAPDAVTEQDYGVLSAAARKRGTDTSGLRWSPAQDLATAQLTLRQSLTDMVWAPAELVFDAPQDMAAAADTPKATAQALRRLASQARSEILIESAYFILADAQLDMMEHLRSKGVRVAALTNSLASNDLVPNHAGYARWRMAMLSKGMELHELRPDAEACQDWIADAEFCAQGAVSLHAKSAVFDRETLYVGSFNVNLRSIYLNGETVLIIHSPELAQRVAADMERAMAPTNSWQVSLHEQRRLLWSADDGQTWSKEPATETWRRFKSRLFSLLPVEKYL